MKVVYTGSKRSISAGTSVLMRNERVEITDEQYNLLGREQRFVKIIQATPEPPVQSVLVASAVSSVRYNQEFYSEYDDEFEEI